MYCVLAESFVSIECYDAAGMREVLLLNSQLYHLIHSWGDAVWWLLVTAGNWQSPTRVSLLLR